MIVPIVEVRKRWIVRLGVSERLQKLAIATIVFSGKRMF
jgi:hypothetical protein